MAATHLSPHGICMASRPRQPVVGLARGRRADRNRNTVCALPAQVHDTPFPGILWHNDTQNENFHVACREEVSMCTSMQSCAWHKNRQSCVPLHFYAQLLSTSSTLKGLSSLSRCVRAQAPVWRRARWVLKQLCPKDCPPVQAHRRMKADAEWEALEQKLSKAAPGWKDTTVWGSCVFWTCVSLFASYPVTSLSRSLPLKTVCSCAGRASVDAHTQQARR